jgi:hypothetical protein
MTVTAVVVVCSHRQEIDMADVYGTRDTSAAPRARNFDRHRLGVTLFLAAAAASFLLSIGLWFAGSREEGVFVGLWVPSILAAGAFWIGAVRRS